ncbi:MAG: hypothetical protein ACRDZW_04100 [Acidimicrobiales bacterium]
MPRFRLRPRLRTSGDPKSANGASSFHLRWMLPPAEALVEVEATLEIAPAPTVERLYFWALQVSFADRHGAQRGGAHVGLQWNPRHPACRAVNWGGYAAGGGLLEGGESALTSTPDDPNTRDYPWSPGRPYRLLVAATPGQPGHWRATVTDTSTGQATVIRDLACAGEQLVAPLVWSEVFARCDHPSVTARWSDLRGRAASGRTVTPRAVQVSYEPGPAGGCDNTDVVPDGDAFLQITNVSRTTAAGAVLALANQIDLRGE